MKRKKHMKSMMLAIVMASALTVSSLPVVAAEIPPDETENLQVEEETGVVLDEEGEDVLSTESGILDTTPPELHSLSIIGETSVKASETIEVVADATDDISGILDVSISFKTDQDFTGTLYTNTFFLYLTDTYYDEMLRRDVKYADGKLHGSAKIPDNVFCGEYYIDAITLCDNKNNRTEYRKDQFSSTNLPLPEYVNNISVIITESKTIEQIDKDIKIKSVTMSDTNLKAPDSIRITGELEENCSDISSIRMSFTNQYEEMKSCAVTALLTKQTDGSYAGDFTVGKYARAGEYILSSVYYIRDDGAYQTITDISNSVNVLQISVVSDITDTEPPVIEEVIPCVDKIRVPGILKLKVIGGDDLSGVKDAFIYFSNSAVNESVSVQWEPDFSPYVYIYFDQYYSSGIYKLSGLDLKDNCGNRLFTIIGKEQIPEHLRNVTFEIINDADTADLVTSTVNDDLLDRIKATNNNAVINIDISKKPFLSKDVLDFVKSTDRVLKLNSSGRDYVLSNININLSNRNIQWEICGNDIVGETRDIDLYATVSREVKNEKICSMLGDVKAIDINLAENSDLPCKAKLRAVLQKRDLVYLDTTEKLYLYRYDNVTEALELIASDIALTKENNLEFDITQGGEYILTTGPAKDTSVIPTGPSTWEDKEGTEGFVYRLYNVALTRDAEEAGLSNWNTQLTGKTKTAAEVAQGIFFSEEFQNHEYNDVQYVKLLYRTMFGREADTVGLKGWLDKLDSGMSREYVFRGFAESQEFENLCKSYNIERGTVTLGQYRDKNEGATGYVARLYTKMLGRKFEEKGIEYWCKEYLTGKVTIENIATNGFLHSQEFTNLNLSNEEFVTRMYQTFLNREPDEAGYKDWVGKLNSGEKTRDDLVYGFSLSQEFANLKKSYGL